MSEPQGSTSATGLRVEYLTAPRAIATAHPRFSWRPGCEQGAYRVEIHRPGEPEPIAATGWVESAASQLLEVPGFTAASDTDYVWRVQLRDAAGGRGDWAEGRFASALLAPEDWSAQWVTAKDCATSVERWTMLDWIRGLRPEEPVEQRLRPVRLLRQRFRVEPGLLRARLFATARGVYAAELNGSPVGDEVLAPGFDAYRHRVSVQCYDVAEQLAPGANVLGVALADGWWSGRIGLTGSSAQFGDTTSALWQLHLDYADGRRQVVASGSDVVAAEGPWTHADLFIGERFDARLHDPAWSTDQLDDAAWVAVQVQQADPSHLVPFVGEPVRRVLTLPAVSVDADPEGGWIVDFGQVIAGRVRITVRGAVAGDEIQLEHTETLDAQGHWFVNIDGINKEQVDTYLANQDETQTWEPSFTFHGFRYLRVRGLRRSPRIQDLVAVVLSSDLAYDGSLRLSDPRLDRLHQNVVWSQRANFLSVPTDCPQRERAGWSGDIQVFAPAATNNAQVALFLTRWLDNLRADQDEQGRVPIISPRSDYDDDLAAGAAGFGSIVACAGWSDAIAIVPWTLYERYGDTRVLADNLDAALAWIEFQTRAAQELPERLHGVELTAEQQEHQRLLYNAGEHFGDWLTPSTLEGRPLHEAIGIAPKLTAEIVAPMFQARTLSLTAASAQVLGRPDLATDLRRRAAAVRAAFAAQYVAADGRLPVDLQGPYVLALAFEMVPEQVRPALTGHLVRLISARGDRLDTGFLSAPYLIDVLWENGEIDLARRVLGQDRMPSWLYQVDRGATTIWESWDAVGPDGTVRPVSMNHYALGCVDDVLYRRVAGITSAAPGFGEILFDPDLTGPVDAARARIVTGYGPVELDWTRGRDGTRIRADVPHGVLATLRVGGQNLPLTAGRHDLRLTPDLRIAPSV